MEPRNYQGAQDARSIEVLPRPAMLDQILEQLTELRERLAQSTGVLGSIVDRVCGPRPEETLKGQAGAIGGGKLAAIGRELDGLLFEIEAIEVRTKRLTVL